MAFFRKNTISILFSFALSYFLILILVTTILQFAGIRGFALAPYISSASLLFTGLYFIKYFLNFNIHFNNPVYLREESGVAFLWLAFSVVSLFIGIAMKNPIVYVVADFVYILIGYMLFATFFHIQKVNANKAPISFTNQLKMIKAFAIFLLTIAILSILFLGKITSVLAVFMLSLGFVFLVLKRFIYAGMLFAPVILQIPFANRALLISVLLCFFIYISRSLTSRKQSVIRNIIILFILFAGLLSGAGGIFLMLEILPKDSPMFFRINQIIIAFTVGLDPDRADMISLVQRLLEVKAVIANWLESPLYFMFSTGLGSVIDGSLLVDSSVTNAALLGGKNVHNIHILPFALIHKYGITGVIIFVLLLRSWFQSFNNILNVRKDSLSITFLFSNMFFCLWLIYSMPASNFLWSTPIFWICFSLKSRRCENVKQTVIERKK